MSESYGNLGLSRSVMQAGNSLADGSVYNLAAALKAASPALLTESAILIAVRFVTLLDAIEEPRREAQAHGYC